MPECLSCLVAVLPFNGVASSVMQQRFGQSLSQANALMSIPFIISAVSSPFLGGLVDRVGQRATLLLVSCFLLGGAHALLGWTLVHPTLALVMIGVGYSLYAAAIWPSVNYVVEKNKLGTAYGIITALQNIGLAVFPLIVGAIVGDGQTHSPADWTRVETFFFFVTVAGAAIGLAILILDQQTGRRLNKSYYSSATSVVEPLAAVTADAPLLGDKRQAQNDGYASINKA